MENNDSVSRGNQSLSRKISPHLAQVPRPQLVKTFITHQSPTKIKTELRTPRELIPKNHSE